MPDTPYWRVLGRTPGYIDTAGLYTSPSCSARDCTAPAGRRGSGPGPSAFVTPLIPLSLISKRQAPQKKNCLGWRAGLLLPSVGPAGVGAGWPLGARCCCRCSPGGVEVEAAVAGRATGGDCRICMPIARLLHATPCGRAAARHGEENAVLATPPV